MICAPSSSRMSCGTAFTDPAVPHGIKAGVSTTPCAVSMRPRRAAPETAWIENGRVTEAFYSRHPSDPFVRRRVHQPPKRTRGPGKTHAREEISKKAVLASSKHFVERTYGVLI